MSTLHVSKKTNQEMLPQLPALESTLADKPEVGTKWGAETADNAVVGVQHRRVETGSGLTCLSQRHSSKSEQSDRGEDRSLAASLVSAQRVLAADKHGNPLIPCHPARARKLLQSGRARVHHLAPFVIHLVDREAGNSVVDGVEVGIDPGSKATGISVFWSSEAGRVGLSSLMLQYRGQFIHKKMQQRVSCRRGRRSRNLRYRAPRFNNRTDSKGWLAPGLRHWMDFSMSAVTKLAKWSPATTIPQELVRFDTQKMENPKISGVEYQSGELAGYEIREYLLAKSNRTCAYCGATDVPLNVDRIHPKSRNGSNHVSNVTRACIPCNQSKDAIELSTWLASRFPYNADAIVKRVLWHAKSPLKDAAAVNPTRWALCRALQATGSPVCTGTGGQTKWNRHQFRSSKSHSLIAICVGQVNRVVPYPSRVIITKTTGRGTHSRTSSAKSGFPRLSPPRTKPVQGFQTGDLVLAVVLTDKKAGIHLGRVAVRKSGSCDISTVSHTVQGIGYCRCVLLQRSDGEYEQREEVGPTARVGLSLLTAEAEGFSSHTHFR
ncbi:MAG: HNH endonuclease [Acidimicrobiaceae bacterium]|nr:HNH endonuclease [Acidimicrobiaceae bacterium]